MTRIITSAGYALVFATLVTLIPASGDAIAASGTLVCKVGGVEGTMYLSYEDAADVVAGLKMGDRLEVFRPDYNILRITGEDDDHYVTAEAFGPVHRKRPAVSGRVDKETAKDVLQEFYKGMPLKKLGL